MSIRALHLTTDAMPDPLGIDDPSPEFAWRIRTALVDVVQDSYRLQVSTDPSFREAPLWDSGRVGSTEPFGVTYAGPALASTTRYWWRVRVWCAHGPDDEVVSSRWSRAAWFETAILEPARWAASWITGEPPASRADDSVTYFRGVSRLGAPVLRARAYVSALGWYRLVVNGTDLTGPSLVPGWTPFDRVVEYQTYDVTEHLREGDNVLAMAVGDGRFRGGLGLTGARERYGDRTAALVQVEADLADGSTVVITTGSDWHAGPGRILGSDPKNGERVDLRVPDEDWLLDPQPPSRFRPARVREHHQRLIAEEMPRVRQVATLAAHVTRAPSGAQILDFGQNFTGVVRLRLAGEAGRTVQLTHSELLTPAGEIDTEWILVGRRRWFQRDTVVLSGEAQWHQPWFTFHGFRYVEVTGLDHDLDPADVEGVVLSTDLDHTGTFTCSDPRLEQLHRNVVWSVRSNFLDTPMDCPTRERSGWTGDIQVFGPTAAILVDAQAYLRRYLRNVALEQFEDGPVPIFVPGEAPTRDSVGRRMMRFMGTSVGWSDVTVLLPLALFDYYGDRRVLERQYDSMRRWVGHLERAAGRSGRARPLSTLRSRAGRAVEGRILDSGFHFGEWNRPGEGDVEQIVRGFVRPSAVVASAYFAHTTAQMARVARTLGRHEDAARHEAVAQEAREAWRTAFVHSDGRIGQDLQDDYVRALAFELLLPNQREAAAARLVALVEAADDHLGTGFLSTPLLLPVLADAGHADVALRLLLQTSSPSWLSQVERGATTIWETWEGFDEEGRGKASHNHYALGSVARWLTEGLAGLAPLAPGYRHFRVAPVLSDALSHVSSSVETPFGTASSEWRTDGPTTTLAVVVPPGTTAEIRLPHREPTTVGSGRHEVSWQRPPR